MKRTLNITVGGEQARIRTSITGDTLNIVASKCYAEYVGKMKLATENKCDMPVPDGSDRVRQPLEPGGPMRPALCVKDMGAFNADMGIRFPDDADKHIKAFLDGEDVPKAFDSVPAAPGAAQMFTVEEVKGLIADGISQALEAAGVVAKAKPVAELDTRPEMILAGDAEKLAGLAEDEDSSDGGYDTTGWSDNQREFANHIIEGMSPEQAIACLEYKTEAARKGALTRFMKVSAIANLIEQMEAPAE